MVLVEKYFSTCKIGCVIKWCGFNALLIMLIYLSLADPLI